MMLPLIANAALLITVVVVIGLCRFYFVLAKKSMTYDDLKPGENHGPRWYASLNRVYINGIESFAVFAPAAILCLLVVEKGELVGTITWAYLATRLLYLLVYVAGGYKLVVSLVWLTQLACVIGLWALVAMAVL